ncbi:unnamed protein product [Cunninghamella blakesleeana]
MNYKKIILLFILLGFFILQTLALEPPPSIEDVSTWTKDQVNQFLQKYHLGPYNKNEGWDQVLKKVKYYQEAAQSDAHYFGVKIDHFLNGVRIQLQKNKQIKQHQLDGYIKDIQHQLRQLELQGSLNGEKVQQTLDKYYHHLLKQKIISQGTFNALKNDIQTNFETKYYQSKPWYQRLFSSQHQKQYQQQASEAMDDAKSSINQWLDHVQAKLKELNILTNEQLKIIRDQIDELIVSKRLYKLATPHWYQRLYHRLEKHAQLSQEQLDAIKDTLENEINAYKIFTMNYLEETKDQTHQWVNGVYGHCQKLVHNTKTHVEDLYHYIIDKIYDYISLSSSKSKAMVEQTKHDVKVKTNSKIQDIKENQEELKHQFDRYWKNKHLEAYRRLGYTEAQIDQIKNQWSQFLQQQQDTVDHSLDQLKTYLQSTKVQTNSQIQKDMQDLKNQLDEWKTKVLAII